MSSAAAASFFLGGHKNSKKCSKQPYIYDVHTEFKVGGLKSSYVFVDSIVFKQ